MRVAIIGAGFTGLTAGLRLAQAGVSVVLYEREEGPGGLAAGFGERGWEWRLEKHYHHIFTSDIHIRRLAREVGQRYFFRSPKTSMIYGGRIEKVDSPISLLRFTGLSWMGRLKTGVGMAYLKYLADWKGLEGETAAEWLMRWDRESYKVMWEPLLVAKFGRYAREVGMAWFWARIKARSSSLGYFEGGFDSLAEKLAGVVATEGAEIRYGVGVEEIKRNGGKWQIATRGGNGKRETEGFDRVLVTGSGKMLGKMVDELPANYKDRVGGMKGLGAVNLVLSLKESLLTNGTYWLNINDPGYPFLAVVEHTNFVEKERYGEDVVVYVGNYVPAESELFGKNEKELLHMFEPYLRRINPRFERSWVKRARVFRAGFAQGVVGVNYSRQLPSFYTPLKGLYWASMQQVYPWDRGTNYAVEMGERVAREIVASA